ncbi:MAG TPA: cytidine deaminase [Pontiella sp.]|nr:cytidine deaminase [Pontiella sp.]
MNPDELIKAARKALNRAHAPYSGYRVGAALLCPDGTVFTGCNVENASYGLTNCAERTAVFSAVAAGRTAFSAIAIAASGEPAPFPCGACRQVLAEFCAPEFAIHIARAEGYETISLGELLPHTFGASDG